MARARWISVMLAAALMAGCSVLGGAEITVDARNDSDFPMTVQVVEGFDAAGNAFGPEHVLDPLEERRLELAVPGGEWHVSVNGARLMDSSDAAGRRGRLPVTLVVPAPDHPAPGPYWEAPVDWAGGAP